MTAFRFLRPGSTHWHVSWRNSPDWARASSLGRLHDHTRHTTVGRTLDELSAHPRDLYSTTHNTHKRQTSMPPAGIEPVIPASERPQTRALDRAATGIGQWHVLTAPDLFFSLSKCIMWLSLPTFLRTKWLCDCKHFDGSTEGVERNTFLGLTIAVHTSIKNYYTIDALHYFKFHR